MFSLKKKRIAELVNLIKNVKHSLKIESGELNCHIYNNPQIADAFRKSVDKITIKVQTSPVICVDEETKKNTIVELWKKGKLKLYTRKVRGLKIHRWIGDDNNIYSEDFHRPCASDEERKVMIIPVTEFWASKANEDFENRIKDNEVEEAQIGSFILLTAPDIRKLYDYFSEKGEDYNFKTKEEIENTQKHFGIKSIEL